MTDADRWRLVEAICDSALEREASERGAFLATACGDDSALRREVEGLLAHAQTAAGFLEAPIGAVANQILGSAADAWLIGRRIGVYEIQSRLGAGGMGEVYRARDTTLGRDVAIKVMPNAFATDSERLARFEREARTLASLNHPHIGAIYGVADDGTVRGLVLELVEGETLADRLARGPLPILEALTVGVQIADALEAAHESGIVHRDLKPANIKIAPSGVVKVLDFGLAKAVADDHPNRETTPPLATRDGTILGTAAYMSPEQARGLAVDKRTDIWAFGCVLYEMLTGRRAFDGRTYADTSAAVLHGDPDWPSLPPDTSEAIERLLRRALEKDPRRRLRDIGDARLEMEEARAAPAMARSDTRTAASSGRGDDRARWLLGTGIVLSVTIGVAAYRVFSRPAAGNAPHAGAERAFSQLTTQPGVEEFPSLSPDGKWIAYEGNQSGSADIYLQSVGGNNAINLTQDSPEDDRQPTFSPDGEQIAFRSERDGGGIFVMGRTGESVRRITDSGFNPAWSPDGMKIVYATDIANHETVLGRMHVSELWTVVVATGEKRLLFNGDAVQPSWSPHGLRIAFWQAFGTRKGQRDIWTISADGDAAVPVTSDPPIDWSPVWSADGHYLYFSSDRGGPMNLWRAPIDEKSGKVLGPLEPLTAPSTSAALMSLSADGRLLAYTSFASHAIMQRVALDWPTATVGGEPVTVIAGSRPFTSPSPSPDGRWLAFTSTSSQFDLFISRTDGSGIRQLTNDRATDKFPTWSPDGQQIAFMSNRDGKSQVWSIRPDGSGLRRLTAASSGGGFFSDWSRDGSKLMFHGQEPPDDSKMFVLDPRVEWTHQTPQAIPTLIETGLKFWESSWSPDGQQLAGTAAPEDKDKGALFVYSFQTGRFSPLYNSQSAGDPIWLNDGRRLLFDDGSKLRLIDSQTRSIRELLSIAPDRLELSSLSRDNRTAYFVRHVSQADIWLTTLK